MSLEFIFKIYFLKIVSRKQNVLVLMSDKLNEILVQTVPKHLLRKHCQHKSLYFSMQKKDLEKSINKKVWYMYTTVCRHFLEHVLSADNFNKVFSVISYFSHVRLLLIQCLAPLSPPL